MFLGIAVCRNSYEFRPAIGNLQRRVRCVAEKDAHTTDTLCIEMYVNFLSLQCPESFEKNIADSTILTLNLKVLTILISPITLSLNPFPELFTIYIAVSKRLTLNSEGF